MIYHVSEFKISNFSFFQSDCFNFLAQIPWKTVQTIFRTQNYSGKSHARYLDVSGKINFCLQVLLLCQCNDGRNQILTWKIMRYCKNWFSRKINLRIDVTGKTKLLDNKKFLNFFSKGILEKDFLKIVGKCPTKKNLFTLDFN